MGEARLAHRPREADRSVGVLAALTEFTRSENGHRLGGPHAMVATKVSDRHLAKRVEIVMAIAEHRAHQVHSTLLVRS